MASGTVALVALTSCDSSCGNEGALGQLGPFVGVGAVAGAVVGTLIGLYVNSQH